MARKYRRSPPLPALPYADISAREDRDYTERLLARIADPRATDDDREAAADTLAALADPRSAAPLLDLLRDRSAPDAARDAAGRALRDVSDIAPDALRAWYDSGDPLLAEHAVIRMDDRLESVIVALAEDPGHPLHAAALAALEFDFEAPRHQELKVRALRHPDPDVRALAASVLVWNEPLIAEEPLIAALGDADPDVAVAAASALQYYPSLRTVRALTPLRTSPHEELRDTALESLSHLAWRMQTAARKAPALRAWLAPIAELLEPEPEPETEASAPPPQPTIARERVDAAAVRAVFDAPGGFWAEKKRWFARLDWQAMADPDRAALAAYFTSHPDGWVREAGCGPLALWNARDALLALLNDPRTIVAKSAAYHLGLITEGPDPAVAARLWRRLDEGGVQSTRATEALHAYVLRAPRDEAVSRLAERARSDARESVREQAIAELVTLGAVDELRALLPLLAAPPAVTWMVHLALLEGCHRHALPVPPDAIASLRAVDNLDVQERLALVLTDTRA